MMKPKRPTRAELERGEEVSEATRDVRERIAAGEEPRRAGHRGTIRDHEPESIPELVLPTQTAGEVDHVP